MFGIQDNAMSTVWPIDAEQFEKWVPAILEVVAVDENGEGVSAQAYLRLVELTIPLVQPSLWDWLVR